MIQTRPLTGQCPHCGAPAWHLAYHSRYAIRGGQIVIVYRCRQCRKTFCDRYGTVFYDLKTPEEKVQRALQHCAMVRESRLLLEVVVGPRTEKSALALVEGAARRLVAGCWPLWSSDGGEPYVSALTVVFAVLIHFIRGKRRGRPKESQVVPDPRLRYGQVIKRREGRRLVSVTRRVIFGSAAVRQAGVKLITATHQPFLT
jgi:transposase-like protein